MKESEQIPVSLQKAAAWATILALPVSILMPLLQNTDDIKLANFQVQAQQDSNLHGTVKKNGVAIVHEPPSNVRRQPNGEILCSVHTKQVIDIYQKQGGWYQTNVCGEVGFIHQDQIRF